MHRGIIGKNSVIPTTMNQLIHLPEVLPFTVSTTFDLNVFSVSKDPHRISRTNCRDIEVPLFSPCFVTDKSDVLSPMQPSNASERANQVLQDPSISEDEDFEIGKDNPPLHLLRLPIELRLKIYGLLLPPRQHRITTQLPHNGSYFSAATVPSHSAQTFYTPPYQRSKGRQDRLTTYKVLTENFGYGIDTAILRTCKQIRDEAEGCLYGAPGVSFDFGIIGDEGVLKAFWGDRSQVARESVRRIGFAVEVPKFEGRWEGELSGNLEGVWEFLRGNLTALTAVELVAWRDDGKLLPVKDLEDEDGVEKRDEVARRNEFGWGWICNLLRHAALASAQVSWWGFEGKDEQGCGFSPWIARRMVGDQVLRAKILKEGKMIEGVVVLPGIK